MVEGRGLVGSKVCGWSDVGYRGRKQRIEVVALCT